MTDLEVTGTWSPAQRALHWLSAGLVLLGFGLGWWMVAVPFSDLLLKFALYQAHKTIGIVVLALALARLALRWRHIRPAWPEAMAPWSRHAARLGHAALYALLLAVPLLGFLTAAAAPVNVPTLLFGFIPIPHPIAPDPARFAVLRPVHRALAILLVALAVGHAGMAIRHHRQGRDTLRRMWRAEC